MNVRRTLYILILALFIAALMPHAEAQDTYSWQVNYQHVILDIDNNGYVDMQYEVDANIVEGVWNEVWIPVTKSDMAVIKVIDGNGVEHEFSIDDGQIKVKGFNLQPGDHVNLKIFSTLYEFVYQAHEKGYVIVTFTPDWWDMSISDTQVKYYLPGNIRQDDIFTGSTEYSNIMTENNRTAVYFESTGLKPDEQFETSVSFPGTVMEQSVTDATATSSPTSLATSCCACLICMTPLFVFPLLIYVIARRRGPYSPPVVGMAGTSNVNKILDPVEAAALLRADPRRVLTMIMFGLMKKGNVKLVSTDPIQLQLVSEWDLNYYEKLFLSAITGDSLDEDKLLECFRVLAHCVVDKTRYYNRKETEEYYREKIRRTWDEIQAVDTPELKLQKYDADMFWLMADEQFKHKTSDYLSKAPGSDTYTVPSGYWWYPYYTNTHHHYHHDGPVITTPTGSTYQPPDNVVVGGKAPVGSPPNNQTTASVESFANSICDRVESVSSGVVGGVERFTGVRDEANVPPPAVRTTAGRPAPGPSTFEGKSSCACVHCACACAHCACACACAGGGHGCT